MEKTEQEIIVEALKRQLGAFAMDDGNGGIRIGYTDFKKGVSSTVKILFKDEKLHMILCEQNKIDP